MRGFSALSPNKESFHLSKAATFFCAKEKDDSIWSSFLLQRNLSELII
jgi:hypothetical protein